MSGGPVAVCLAQKASIASQTVNAKSVNGPFPQELTFGTHTRMNSQSN